jgi:hypothetical protein
VAFEFEFGRRKSVFSLSILDLARFCDWSVQIRCAAVCAKLRLILGVLLEQVPGIGNDEGDQLDAEVDDHVHEVGVVSSDAWSFILS